MLKQTLEAPYDPGPLKIDGPNVQFTEAEQFLSKLTDGKKTDRFQVWIETHKSNVFNTVRTTFRKGKNGIEIAEMTKENSGPDQTLSAKPLTLYPEMLPEKIKSLGNQDPAFKNFDIVKRSRCFLYLGSSQYSSNLYEVTYGFGAYIFSTIHLPGLRGNPERAYKLSSTGPQYPGTFQYYAASIIHEWQEKKDERLKMIADELYTLGLTGQVGTKKIGDVGIELQVGRFLNDNKREADLVSIADVGFGVSQVLPAIVALIAAEPVTVGLSRTTRAYISIPARRSRWRGYWRMRRNGVSVSSPRRTVHYCFWGFKHLLQKENLPPELVKLALVFTEREDGVTDVSSVPMWMKRRSLRRVARWILRMSISTIQSGYHKGSTVAFHFGKEET